MEALALKGLTDYGIAGVLVAVLFVFYRKDVKAYTDLWRTQSELMLTVVKENTSAITANTEVTRAMHKRLDIIEAVMEANRNEHVTADRRNRH